MAGVHRQSGEKIGEPLIPEELQPYRQLWAAVLDRAVRDARNTATLHSHKARDWIKSECREPSSYLWICDVLGLSPHTIRNALNGKTRTPPRNVADRLKHYRQTHNLSQKKLAAIIGCGQGSITYIETGRLSGGKIYRAVVALLDRQGERDVIKTN